MKRHALNRYERDDDGNILIDVAATRAEDLYNDFDRHTPYIRRDLDQDLVDYLIECAREIGDAPFAIRFTLAQPPDETRLARIQQSVRNFFLYLNACERQKIRRLTHRSLLLLALGTGMLFVSVWATARLPEGIPLLARFLVEGLTVVAWVTLWESLGAFLLEWLPHRRDLRLYRTLAEAAPLFRTRI